MPTLKKLLEKLTEAPDDKKELIELEIEDEK